MSALTAPDFQFVAELVRRESAIVIEPGKEYLVETRLSTVVRQAEVPDIATLVQRIKAGRDSKLSRWVVDAMTTNETSFFRDNAPFVALRTELLPAYKDKVGPLRIWSAASSSGQEAYSIAMAVAATLPDRIEVGRLEILATDISETMLERCRSGIYSQLEVNRGLPARDLVTWFTREGTTWQVKPVLRQLVTAKPLNLAQPFGVLARQDVVMLRNVLIYFDEDTKRAILRKVASVISPDGWLFLGAGEDASLIDPQWERHQLAGTRCYKLRQPGASVLPSAVSSVARPAAP